MPNIKPPKYIPPTTLIRVYLQDKKKLERIAALGQTLPAAINQMLRFQEGFIDEKKGLNQQVTDLTEQLEYFQRIPQTTWDALDARKKANETTSDVIKRLILLSDRVEQSGGFLTKLEDLS